MLMMATFLREERCPRCRGNVCLKEDIHGTYWQCLQCGQTWDIEVKHVVHKRGPRVPG